MRAFLLSLFLLSTALNLPPVCAEASESLSVQKYSHLVAAIRKTRQQTKQRIESLVEQERVREAWQIGKLINTHVLQNKPRADYDKEVVKRLARDLESSRTEIWYCLEFARAYPMLRPAGVLTWSHYQALLAVNDSLKREELAQRAEKENWGRDRLREEIRKMKAAQKSEQQTEKADEPLTAKLGKPGVYRIVEAKFGPEAGELVLDLGFSNYLALNEKQRRLLQEDQVVKADKDSFKLKPHKAEFPANDLYTYRAYLIEVIDGDTIKAVIDLGFGLRTVQTLRLRALDAPEIDTEEGKQSKTFLKNILPAQFLIRTHKSDKYDRYLADVFAGDNYINQQLMEHGLAVRVSE